MKFKERFLRRMFSFKFSLCCRKAQAFPKHKEERMISNSFNFLSYHWACLAEGDICFPLATDLNTQVHFIKENNHYVQSQLQLLGNLTPEVLFPQVKPNDQFSYFEMGGLQSVSFLFLFCFYANSSQLQSISVKSSRQSNDTCHKN